MNLRNTTGVPNALFDSTLPVLNCSELKILLVIVRQTLGWKDKQTCTGRKSRDWISSSQLMKKTGCSRRSISTAIASLVEKKFISVTNFEGAALTNSQDRKGKPKLFFQLENLQINSVDSMWKTTEEKGNRTPANEKIAQYLSNKITGLAQQLHITKETHTNRKFTKVIS